MKDLIHRLSEAITIDDLVIEDVAREWVKKRMSTSDCTIEIVADAVVRRYGYTLQAILKEVVSGKEFSYRESILPAHVRACKEEE